MSLTVRGFFTLNTQVTELKEMDKNPLKKPAVPPLLRKPQTYCKAE